MVQFKFKSLSLAYETECDCCTRKIYPRVDSAFRDFSYDITFCITCWTAYTKENIKDNRKHS